MSYRVAILVLSLAAISYAAVSCKPWSCENISSDYCATVTTTGIQVNEDSCDIAGCTITYIEAQAAGMSSGGSIPCETKYETGTFSKMSTYTGSWSGSGKAQMKRGSSSTTVRVSVNGLTAGGYYAAHVHTASCAAGASGHYMQDTAGAVDKWNEIWPSFYVSDSGLGYAEVDHDWVARPDAVSIVIHDTPNASSGSGAKMLCADLAASSSGIDSDLDTEETAYNADFATKPAEDSSSKPDYEKATDPAYTCAASDTGYRLAEGSHPKNCGVNDGAGDPQPSTSLCQLANGQNGSCGCSLDGNYYCVPSEYDDTVSDFSWYWDDCSKSKMTEGKRAWYLSKLSHYPTAAKFDSTLDDCKSKYDDKDYYAELDYSDWLDAQDDHAFMLAFGLLLALA